MHELEALAAKRPAELMHVARQGGALAAEEQPTPSTVGRGPDVREARDGTGVDDRAGLAEELGCRARRAVDVRLEMRAVELADQVRQRFRRAAELGAVMDEQYRGRPR